MPDKSQSIHYSGKPWLQMCCAHYDGTLKNEDIESSSDKIRSGIHGFVQTFRAINGIDAQRNGENGGWQNDIQKGRFLCSRAWWGSRFIHWVRLAITLGFSGQRPPSAWIFGALPIMIVKQQSSGFHVWNDYMKDAPGLGVDSKRIDEFVAWYREEKYRGLFGNPSFGFDQDNLDFLIQTMDAKWLWFWYVKLKNIDAIYELTQLEHMGIHPKRPGIDFSRLSALRTVINHWIKKDTGISE